MAWERKTPFGYMVRDGKTVPCPKEAEAVRHIFSSYLNGASYAKIAEEMTKGNIPYHRRTAQWNKHMVKRILENGKYLGTEIYPQLVSERAFLTVQLRRGERTSYTPCPTGLAPIREKAVCAVCGNSIKRDIKTHGRPRWVCTGPDCGAVVRIDDEELQAQVSGLLRQLADDPGLLAPPPMMESAPSMEMVRLRNELNLCFNRTDIDSGYMKTLIFALAAGQYESLPDPTPAHDMEILRGRLTGQPADDAILQELLEKAVKHIHIGSQGYIGLELLNGIVIKEGKNA